MRLLSGACCALRAAALVLLLLVPGSQTDNSSSTTPFTMISVHELQGNSSSSNLTVTSSTQSTATSAVGLSTSTTHLPNSSQPTNTTTSGTLTTQPTKISQTTRSTTASSVTSSQLNITVVTTSKISFTSVTELISLGDQLQFHEMYPPFQDGVYNPMRQATSKSEAGVAKTSRFDVGSFVGGIVLTLGVLVILYIGCKTYHSRRGIQYRTIDEHDAII